MRCPLDQEGLLLLCQPAGQEMDGRGEISPGSQLPGYPSPPCLLHPSLVIPLQSCQHHTNTVCLTYPVILSAVRHRASEWQGLVMRLKCFLSAQEKGFSGNREWRNTGAWWGLAADFISLSEMIFALVDEGRELGRKSSLKITPRWCHQTHWDRWEQEPMRSRWAPARALLSHQLRVSRVPGSPVLVQGLHPLVRNLTNQVLFLIVAKNYNHPLCYTSVIILFWEHTSSDPVLRYHYLTLLPVWDFC